MEEIKEYKESLIENPLKELFYTFSVDSKTENFKGKNICFSDESGNTYFGEVIKQKYYKPYTFFRVKEKHKVPECFKTYVDLTT